MTDQTASSKGQLEIREYDPLWPVLFEQEKSRIQQAVGDKAVRIEHIGSTAVPGLGAKPIIDILIGVRKLSDANDCVTPLQSIEYEYAPEYEKQIAERRYFRKGPKGSRTHHIHMVELNGPFWERHLLFRDFLRRHPSRAREYQELKRSLAENFGADHEGYTNAKTGFVRSVEEEAWEERTAEKPGLGDSVR